MNKDNEELFKRVDAQLAQMAAAARVRGWDKHDSICPGRLRDAWCWCGATDLRRSIRKWEETH